eukprot:COSAG02_NODE_5973_length_3901_cov_1.859811_1_plen_75_part_00
MPEQPSSEQAEIPLDDDMPVEESDAPVKAPRASKEVPETVKHAIHSYLLTNGCSADEIYERESCCMLIFSLISV